MITVEDVKAMIRARIDRKLELDLARLPIGGYKSKADDLQAHLRWKEVSASSDVLCRLLDEIEAKEAQQ